MKNMNMLVWLTQLGLSVAVPPTVYILLAAWLHNANGWGSWVVWAAVALGVYSAIQGLRTSLKAMARMESGKKDEAPVSYNDHT